MEQWRYSATAVDDSLEEEGEDGDSPIFDVEVLLDVDYAADEMKLLSKKISR